MKNLLVFMFSVFCFFSCEKELTLKEQLYEKNGEWFCEFTFGDESHEVRSYGANAVLFGGGDELCAGKQWSGRAVFSEGGGENGNIYPLTPYIQLYIQTENGTKEEFIGTHEVFRIAIVGHEAGGYWEDVDGFLTIESISDDFIWFLNRKQNIIRGKFDVTLNKRDTEETKQCKGDFKLGICFEG